MSEANSQSSLVSKMPGPSEQIEKRWWQSKKFFAFIVTELGFFALMAFMILSQQMDKLGDTVSFMVLAVSAGFLAVGFILGQAYLDKYIRVALITMGRDPGSPPQTGLAKEEVE